MAAIATVVNIKGEVFAVNVQGVKRQLHNGDKLQEGEVLVTAPGSTAELEMDGGKHFTVPEHQTFVIDASVASGAETPEAASAALAEGSGVAQKVIQALQSGDPNALIEAEATAAGLAGQGGGDEGGVSFVRLLRIAEGVSPVGFEFGINAHAVQDVTFTGAVIEETQLAHPPTILVGDGGLLAESATATALEPALNPSGTNAGGVGSLVDGKFLVSDPEGVSSLVSVTINGTVIPMGNLVGTVIVGQSGTLTITGFDPATGLATFTYQLTTATTDVPNQPETDIFTFTTTDGVDTSNQATVTIFIQDDVPQVNVADVQTPSLTVDETDLAVNASASFSGLFTSIFGADGPAAANAMVYSLNVSSPNVDSGVIDTATGQHVLLSMNGGVVEGRTAGSNELVFTISVNSTTGEVTLDQIRAVMHDSADAGTDTNEAVSLNANVLSLSLAVTDGDGDTTTASTNISGAFSFLDDGPSISLADVSTPLLSVDETVLATNDTANFSSVFTSSFGADGAGSLTYGLSINGGNGTDSGLVDSLTGQHVLLYMNGSNIEGRDGDGDVVFVISVDGSGNVTLDQQRAVMHDTASDPDTSEPASIDANLVVLTATVTDADGDSASANIDLGARISFLDDGPTITVDNLGIANVAGTYEGEYAFNVGADGQSFDSSFGSSSLVWLNPRDGYTLEYDAGASSATEQVYHGTFDGGASTFFDLIVKSDGTYDFVLVDPDPVTEVNIASLLAGITGGSNLSSYTIDSSHFNGQFDLLLTGYTDGVSTLTADTLTISSTELGVSDNVMQGNKGDVLRFDVVPVGGSDSTLSSLTIHVATTAGWKATDSVEMIVHYTTGSDTTTSQVWGTDQEVTFNFDATRTVDWVEIAPSSSSDSFKIDGVSLSYTTQQFPSDYQLDFQLTGSDADQDTALASFSVAVNTTDTSTYEIQGTSGADHVYGTTGDDILVGGTGDDQLTGDLGADTFKWLTGDQGTTGTPAVDTIVDFGNGADKLDLRDLLQGEHGGGATPNLTDFLHFNTVSGTTTVSISTTGHVADGPTAVDQQIVLQGVDLTEGGAYNTDAAIIAHLLATNKLVVDG